MVSYRPSKKTLKSEIDMKKEQIRIWMKMEHPNIILCCFRTSHDRNRHIPDFPLKNNRPLIGVTGPFRVKCTFRHTLDTDTLYAKGQSVCFLSSSLVCRACNRANFSHKCAEVVNVHSLFEVPTIVVDQGDMFPTRREMCCKCSSRISVPVEVCQLREKGKQYSTTQETRTDSPRCFSPTTGGGCPYFLIGR